MALNYSFPIEEGSLENINFVFMRTVNFKIPDAIDLDDNDLAMIMLSALYDKSNIQPKSFLTE